VAVIIPTRDRAALLWETLRSVREQTYPPSEVIVVDDGSRDRTAEVAAEFGAQLLRNERGGWGPARARNAGAARAQATHLLFLDSDDLLVPDALERLSAALVGAPQAPFAFGRGLAARREAAGWRSEGVIRPADWEPATYRRRLYVTNVVPSGGALVVGERFHAVGGYDPRVVHSEDHHLWLRLSRLGMPAYVPRVVIVHRRHATNRGMPGRSLPYYRLVDELAATDPELIEALPARRGVQAVDLALEAVRARSPRALLFGARRLLEGGGRWQALRAAAWHLRDRRRRAREGRELLAREASFANWLGSHR